MTNIAVKYHQFLIENDESLSKETQDTLIKTFFDALDQSIKETFKDASTRHLWFDFKVKNMSYSYFARSSENPRDIEKDFADLQETMNSHGWTEDRVSKLFNQCGTRIIAEYEDEKLLYPSGIVDNYLYHYNNETLLGGFMNMEEPEEIVIKFLYGWHKTSYGQAATAQVFGNVEHFIETVCADFEKALTNNEYSTYSDNWKDSTWTLLNVDYNNENDHLTFTIDARDIEEAEHAALDIVGDKPIISKTETGKNEYEITVAPL